MERLVAFPKDTHPHKAGDASGYAFLWEEMDRASGLETFPRHPEGHRNWEDVTLGPKTTPPKVRPFGGEKTPRFERLRNELNQLRGSKFQTPRF